MMILQTKCLSMRKTFYVIPINNVWASVSVRNSIYCELNLLIFYADEIIDICTVDVTMCIS